MALPSSCLLLLILASGCTPSAGSTEEPSLLLDATSSSTIRLAPVGAFEEPVQVISPPDDSRLFVVERTGKVKISADDPARQVVFLDLTGMVSTEQERGLFSIAFAPDYRSSGLVYVSYTDSIGNNRIVEYTVDPSDGSRADPGSRRQILHVTQNSPIHNGGLIGFDPTGMLLVAIGDGGPNAPAQDRTTLLGKFLRIDPRNPSGDLPYSIPLDNPFVSAEGVRPEIWAYGLRNPWRWAFDPDTDDLYVADVGENASEEINFVPKELQPGANYGWPRFEGEVPFFADHPLGEGPIVNPVATIAHTGTNCAVIGGGIYRGSVSSIGRVYLYGDFCDGRIRGMRVSDGSVEMLEFDGLKVPQLVSFGEDSEGEMYAVSLKGGVFRFTGPPA